MRHSKKAGEEDDEHGNGIASQPKRILRFHFNDAEVWVGLKECWVDLEWNEGQRSQIDVGVISGEDGEPHYFVNVADIHCKVNLEILVKAQAAMVAKVRHKRLVNLMGLMVKVLNNPRCNLMHSELCSSILPSYHLNHLIDYLRPLKHNHKVYKHIRSMKETKAQS
ncbi:hypothetical protein ACFX13_047013 [Malus domestica]